MLLSCPLAWPRCFLSMMLWLGDILFDYLDGLERAGKQYLYSSSMYYGVMTMS